MKKQRGIGKKQIQIQTAHRRGLVVTVEDGTHDLVNNYRAVEAEFSKFRDPSHHPLLNDLFLRGEAFTLSQLGSESGTSTKRMR